jgi:plasmid stability protein
MGSMALFAKSRSVREFPMSGMHRTMGSDSFQRVFCLADYRRRDDIIMQSNRPFGNGVMGQVVIRNIDDRVIERLRERAVANRKSLEQSLRELLTEAARPSRAELVAELERIRAMAPPRKPGVVYPSAEQLVREDRDTR